MAPKVFIDSSAWLAYIIKGEKDHTRVKSVFINYLRKGTTIFTSNDIIDETVTRLIYAADSTVVSSFLTLLDKSFTARVLTQIWVDGQIQLEAFNIVKKYADQKLSLTDATSMVIIKRYNIEAILTLDSDFAKLGFNSAP